jgi:histidinol-phosphate phosphatase family protein
VNPLPRRPGLLLDRDGVINREQGYVLRPDALVVHPQTARLIAAANEAGWGVGVITNQGCVAKGLLTLAGLAQVHAELVRQLNDLGAQVDGIWFCPHHPEVQACLCRKPQTLLFERAIHALHLEPARTWMIGDRVTDLEPARRLGLHTCLISNNYSEFKPSLCYSSVTELTVPDFFAAVTPPSSG